MSDIAKTKALLDESNALLEEAWNLLGRVFIGEMGAQSAAWTDDAKSWNVRYRGFIGDDFPKRFDTKVEKTIEDLPRFWDTREIRMGVHTVDGATVFVTLNGECLELVTECDVSIVPTPLGRPKATISFSPSSIEFIEMTDEQKTLVRAEVSKAADRAHGGGLVPVTDEGGLYL